MSGSLTVVGGVNNSTITGLVTVPAVLPNIPNILSNLQSFLSGTVQTDVLSGVAVANFSNLNVAGLSGVNTVPAVQNSGITQGLLDITNTDSVGNTVTGSTNVSVQVPVGYNFLIVQAPGTETITGNGSDSFLGVFGSQSGVTFNSNGGSGTVVAGGAADFVDVTGGTWSVVGNAAGGAVINSTAQSLSAYVSGSVSGGSSNVVGLAAANASVTSAGSNDLIAAYGGNDLISVASGANVIVDGGSVTINALAGSSSVTAFFGSSVSGGSIYFVNNSTVAAAVTGSSDTTLAAGSVTVFAGKGGGYYQGGAGGHNYLTGGTTAGAGNVTLIGGGIGNTLEAYFGNNKLFAASGGQSTLIAGAGTGDNNLSGGGNDSMISSGTGLQAFFFGTNNVETVTGSTVSGATNRYFVFENASQGGGLDVITNFNSLTSTVYINPQGYTTDTGVSINGFSAYTGPGGGTNVQLTDGTTIRLLGVSLSASQEAAITTAGGTTF